MTDLDTILQIEQMGREQLKWNPKKKKPPESDRDTGMAWCRGYARACQEIAALLRSRSGGYEGWGTCD